VFIAYFDKQEKVAWLDFSVLQCYNTTTTLIVFQ
jgi:hypothetical protein